MTEPSFAALAAAAAGAALVVGFLKTSVGGGIGLAVTPVLTIFLPPQAALGLIALMLCLSDPFSLFYYWRQWHARQLRLLLPGVLLGILLGSWLLWGLSSEALRKLIGGSALGFSLFQLVMLWGRLRLAGAGAPWPVGAAMGVLGGVASAVAHSGGIFLGPYLVGLGLSNAAVVATGAAVVAVSNVLKLAAYWGIGFMSWALVGLALLSTPLIYAGSWLGYRVNALIPPRLFAVALLGLAMAGSIKLLLG